MKFSRFVSIGLRRKGSYDPDIITREEIQSTINHNIDHISDLIGNSTPVNVKYVRECANTDINEDFYQFYQEWCWNRHKKCGGIEEFRDYLLKLTDKKCREFSNVSFSTYEVTSPVEFDQLVHNLKEYKQTHRGYGTVQSAKTDVNNFFYVSEQNAKDGVEDFLGLNYYHISADHHFCNWAKSIKPGSIPEVILPSVWYSIILHYYGRATENDYASFTRFLYFSHNH